MHRARRRPGARGRLTAALLAAGTAAAWCAVAVALAGCGAAASSADAAVTHVSTSGGVTARLALSPQPAPVMRALRLSVALTGPGGEPLGGRAVAFDLAMPSMTMAPNRPAVAEVRPGVYEATTLLSMPGEWRLVVELDDPAGPLYLPVIFVARQ